MIFVHRTPQQSVVIVLEYQPGFVGSARMRRQLGVKPGRPGSSWKQERRGKASESQKGKQLARRNPQSGPESSTRAGDKERKEGAMRGQEEEVQVHVKYNKHSGRLLL